MSVHQRITATKKTPKKNLKLDFAGLFFFILCCFCTILSVFLLELMHLCPVFWFVSYPKLKDAWKYCNSVFLLLGPTWSIGDTHHLVQKEPLSPSDSCKGSILQTKFGQQIPNTQDSPGRPELNRDSQPHFLRSLTQPDSTSSVSELFFIWCANTAACTAVLRNPVHWEAQQRKQSILPHEGSKFKIFNKQEKQNNHLQFYFTVYFQQS